MRKNYGLFLGVLVLTFAVNTQASVVKWKKLRVAEFKCLQGEKEVFTIKNGVAKAKSFEFRFYEPDIAENINYKPHAVVTKRGRKYFNLDAPGGWEGNVHADYANEIHLTGRKVKIDDGSGLRYFHLSVGLVSIYTGNLESYSWICDRVEYSGF